MNPSKHSLYEFAQFQFEVETCRLLLDGQVVPLPLKAAVLLHFFLQQPGKVCRKEDLLQTLWGEETVEDANLSQTVYLLRKALNQSETTAQFIETIPKIGYRFIPEVRTAQCLSLPEARPESPLALPRTLATESLPTPSAVETSVATFAAEPARELMTETPRRSVMINGSAQGMSLRETVLSLVLRRTEVSQVATGDVASIPFRQRRGLKAAAVALCLLSAIILFFLFRPNSAGIHSLAVLPFTELGSAGQDETLGLGLADALITRLSNLGTLTVRPTNAVERYVKVREDLLTLGRKLDVDALLDGRLQRSGDHLRLTVQLIRVQDGKPLWAESFEEISTDLLSVQKTISERIAHALTLKLTAQQQQRLQKDYTANTAAFQAYMKGRFFLAKRVSESIQQALGYFEEAIELDPTYALAYTGIADCYIALGTPQIMMGAEPQEQAYAKAKSAARKALELDGTLAEAHASLGASLLIEDDAAGHRELERSIALNPNYVQAYNYYGTHLLGDGLPTEALAKFNRAIDLDPLSILSNANLGMALYRLRRYDEAIQQFKKTLEMDANAIRAHWGLGMAYEQQGRYDEALAEFQRLETLSKGGPLAVTALGHLYAHTGKRAEAERYLALLLTLHQQGTVSGYYVAVVYVGLGEHEQALAWLAKSKLPAAAGLLKIDAYFDPIRSSPRFPSLP